MPTVTQKPIAKKQTEDPRAVKARKMDALVRSIAASKSETADIDAQPVKKVAVKRIVAAKPQQIVKKEEPKQEIIEQKPKSNQKSVLPKSKTNKKQPQGVQDTISKSKTSNGYKGILPLKSNVLPNQRNVIPSPRKIQKSKN